MDTRALEREESCNRRSTTLAEEVEDVLQERSLLAHPHNPNQLSLLEIVFSRCHFNLLQINFDGL